MATSDSTLLVLSGVGVPEWSARGLTQTLRPIRAAASQRRTINGTLTNLSETQFEKYESTISGQDHQSPSVNGVWPGRIVTVDCIVELAYESNSGGPDRTAVAGSEREEGGFSFYRPQLTMMVTSFRINTDEWGAEVGWRIELEEV